MRIEKVGGNRKGSTVGCLRQLCFAEEKKIRFSSEESTLSYRDFGYLVLLLSRTYEKLLRFRYRNLRCLLSRAQP
ncbi:hypothetical protein E2C01_038504 [Portunus trituberculatus]|uniref:Uncharacterized protein n=1 Tax=Portunus trituberculatus TaxID=210409 RepID=A0A5B7FKA9_PORTR|nr:hypothetical protein [Portunus trituberculatus]